jgi:nucleoside-diphosphate-sugar epimerase
MKDHAKFNNTRIVVVGGAGFVGSNLVKMILSTADPCEVIIVDNLLSAEKSNIPDDKRVVFREGSIAGDAVLATLQDDIDYLFHLATYHGNQSSIHDPLADHENNTLTTLKLFERIKGFRKLQKVVYSSAGCAVAEKTYDQAHATAEDAPISLKMDSPYSISKIIGEFYSVYYHDRHGLPTVRARFQNVYGPGEILGAGQWRGTPATVWRNVTPTFVYKSLKRETLPVEGGEMVSRDFIFVDDICRGLIACALAGKSGDVYNLASGVETSIKDLAGKINSLTDNPVPIEVKPARQWDHSGKRFGSTLKSRKYLNFEARVALSEGLQTTIEWTRQNLPLIESCMKKHDAQMKSCV